STTWRGLSDKHKDGVTEKKAVALMAEHPTLIKRPLFERGDQVRVGFDDDVRAWLESG
ncbi:MAG: ArsC/Spx/MgsR family protein, partial [Wenzhouxiangellaceae bacterium]